MFQVKSSHVQYNNKLKPCSPKKKKSNQSWHHCPDIGHKLNTWTTFVFFTFATKIHILRSTLSFAIGYLHQTCSTLNICTSICTLNHKQTPYESINQPNIFIHIYFLFKNLNLNPAQPKGQKFEYSPLHVQNRVSEQIYPKTFKKFQTVEYMANEDTLTTELCN